MSAPVLDLVLDPPIKVGAKTYDRLHLAEPTARMVEKAEQELGGSLTIHALRLYQITLVAVAAGVPRSVVEAMPVSQVKQAADFLGAFIAQPEPEPAQPAKTKKQKRKGKRRRAP